MLFKVLISVMYRHEGVMSKDELISTLKSMNLIHD